MCKQASLASSTEPSSPLISEPHSYESNGNVRFVEYFHGESNLICSLIYLIRLLNMHCSGEFDNLNSVDMNLTLIGNTQSFLFCGPTIMNASHNDTQGSATVLIEVSL